MAGERENTVAVIGGLGRMGVVTRRIFAEAGYIPIISDTKDPKTLSPREAIRQSGIIFFSVLPIENIEGIIRLTADVFDETHRVLDNASWKGLLQEGYEILDQRGVSICSTHPLCNEKQPLFGQKVLIAPFGQRPQMATLLAESVYQRAGMVLRPIDFGKHDLTMLYNQLLPQLANRAVGHTLAQSGVDVEALLAISTANSQLFSLANWRTLGQPSEISAMLISKSLQTPEGQAVVQALIDSIGAIRQQGVQQEELEATFSTDVASLDPTGKTRAKMNEASIIILEHLANLAKRSFVVETREKDRPGLLHELSGVIAANHINLNTALSQRIEGGFRFHLGIEDGELTPEIIEQLGKLGYQVIHLTNPRS